MAVWRYKGEFIPRLWLIEQHKDIPLFLDNYLLTDETVVEEIDAPNYWHNRIIPSDFVERVTAILPQRKSWSENAIMFGDERGNDLAIWSGDGLINSVDFRWDLRQPDLGILNHIIALANHLDAYVISGDRASIVEPNVDLVLADIKKSSAYRFCQNPLAFIEAISQNSKKA